MKRDLSEDQLRQEVTVSLPLSVVLRIADQPERAVALAARPSDLPMIGAEYEGGLFAGTTLDGDQLAALVLLPSESEGPWKDCLKWAEEKAGVLPSRIDQLVLFKNLKAEFKDAWYWSGEQHADGADSAWLQYFGHGDQLYGYVSLRYRARAVRRIPIR